LFALLIIADVAVEAVPGLGSPTVLMSVVRTLAVCVVQVILSPLVLSTKVADVPALSEPLRVLDLDDVMLRAEDMAGNVANPTASIAAVIISFFIL
jgi:hypothetical protein